MKLRKYSVSLGQIIASAAVVVLATAYSPATLAETYEVDDTPSAGAMAIDAVLVRPMAFTSTVVGGALFVLTLPFSAIGGNVPEAGEKLFVDPARMTFVRPLGEFDSD